ncbi:MAG: hypothetical protein AAFS10_09305 [Myxococcota bacterium]
MKRLTRTEWYQSIAWVLDSTSPLKPAWLTSPVAMYRNLIETNHKLVWGWLLMELRHNLKHQS